MLALVDLIFLVSSPVRVVEESEEGEKAARRDLLDLTFLD
jgi:hypothetical protein